jgi:hypothetical protein
MKKERELMLIYGIEFDLFEDMTKKILDISIEPLSYLSEKSLAA